MGQIWATWHISLVYNDIFAPWKSAARLVAWLTAWSVVQALIVLRSKGAVLPSIIVRWTFNDQTALICGVTSSTSSRLSARRLCVHDRKRDCCHCRDYGLAQPALTPQVLKLRHTAKQPSPATDVAP